MPTVKSSFPMTSWKRSESVFTVGGMNSRSLKEVQQYFFGKNEWQALQELPDFSYDSAATVLDDVLYSFGGHPSKYSVQWYDLLRREIDWKTVKYFEVVSFKGDAKKGATVVGSKVVYFGGNKGNKTYILERGREQLKSSIAMGWTGLPPRILQFVILYVQGKDLLFPEGQLL